MNTPVYMNDNFMDLISLLRLLNIIDVNVHKVSHATMMIVTGPPVPSHWIPIPTVGLYVEYIEIVGASRRE
jgi:hypothetical protein